MSIKTVLLAATTSMFIVGAAHAGGQGASPGAMENPSEAMESSPGGGGAPEGRKASPTDNGAPSGAPRAKDEGSDARPAEAATDGGAGDDRKAKQASPDAKDATDTSKQASPDAKDATDTSKSGATQNKSRDSSETDRSISKDATNKGEDGKSTQVDREQVNKARTYFRQNKPSVKAVERNEISVSIGLALPSSIVLYDVPPDVIVVSGGCPIKYFLWGDDIVLVDSCTREVIDII